MNLLASDPRLGPLCESLTRKLATARELETLTMEIEVLPDFDALSDNPEIRTSPAAYRNRRVIVNERNFFLQGAEAQPAIIAHELAHAVYERGNLRVHHLYSQTNEEFIADLLAAKWGYAEELSAYRRAERGEEYVHILRNWQDEKAFVASVDAWHIAWATAALVRGADRPNRRPTSM